MNQKQYASAWKKNAIVDVNCLAKEQMARWTAINPAWVKQMPGQDSQKAKMLTPTKGVAGENFQAPSMPGPYVTSIQKGPTNSAPTAQSLITGEQPQTNKVLGICPKGWAAIAAVSAFLFWRKS